MAETAALQSINGLRAARRSPASHLAAAFEAGSVSGAVTLREVPFQTMAGIRVDRNSDAGKRLAAVTGGLPDSCGLVDGRDGTGLDGTAVFWLGPLEFLVVAPESAHESLGGDLIRALNEALGDGEGQVVDLSANRTVFELAGPRARDVLEKGCSLDLHPRVHTLGTALSTEVGGIPLVLHKLVLNKTGEEAYQIFPRASFADFLGRWLLDGMREFASPEVP